PPSGRANPPSAAMMRVESAMARPSSHRTGSLPWRVARQTRDQIVGAEHAAPVRNALVVERPAHFFCCSARAGCARAAGCPWFTLTLTARPFDTRSTRPYPLCVPERHPVAPLRSASALLHNQDLTRSSRSRRLEPGEFYNLAPLFGFVRDELAGIDRQTASRLWDRATSARSILTARAELAHRCTSRAPHSLPIRYPLK